MKSRVTLINDIANAIATMEGFFNNNSLAFKNNNPGNIRKWGKLPIVKGFASFPTAEAGWAALKRQISLNINRKLTLYEFFGGKPGVYPGYAPATDNNKPKQYAEFVAKKVGIPPNELIIDHIQK